MADLDYDVLVIGTGPGGEGAAMQAIKSGLRVAVVERYTQIGGGCTHWGTIPSKALRYAILQATDANSSPLFREAGVNVSLQFPQLRRSARSVIEKQVDMRRGFYDRNQVPVIVGHARLLDPNTVLIGESKGAAESVSAKHLVIATGSRPYRPADVDFVHPRIFDS